MEKLNEADKQFVMDKTAELSEYLETFFRESPRLREILDSDPLKFHATDAEYATPLGKILLKMPMYPEGVAEKDPGTETFCYLLKLQGYLFENNQYFRDRIGWMMYWYYAYVGVLDRIFEDNFQPSAWNKVFPFRREKQ